MPSGEPVKIPAQYQEYFTETSILGERRWKCNQCEQLIKPVAIGAHSHLAWHKWRIIKAQEQIIQENIKPSELLLKLIGRVSRK